MIDKVFVDTNILVYCFDDAAPVKKKIAMELISTLWETPNGVLSLQVLKEFFVVVTKKLPKTMACQEAKRAIHDLLTWNIFYETKGSFEKALEITERDQLSFWDANIVSAAILSDCHLLYSEDMQHSRIIESVKIINPFLENPDDAERS